MFLHQHSLVDGDRYLYFEGDVRSKLYVYSLEYPQLNLSNGSIWRKTGLDGC